MADTLVDSAAAGTENVAAAGRIGLAVPALQTADQQLLRKKKNYFALFIPNSFFKKGICECQRGSL
jgi:hypothetical protein